ncbi:heme exporter protein CcmB [Aestuariivirga litoralis]|uniref:heme exporter protein CcmB n=1 Tax=Aestuariivirga litoralis TaxID=2650924 RepID=UPI0018C6BCB7|nr:heme exporter protein CcmB [Aestuariivirga litoralis]MBG1233657.1 heme exporter protein CcmB [Aestuariivirga litoralis]
MRRQLMALVKRDLTLARKQGGGLGAALSFMLAVVVLVPLAVGPDLNLLARLAAGLMWLSLLLAVLLTADRIFQQDFEDGSLDLMTMTALPFELVVLTKALTHWLSVSLPLALIAPPLGLMLNLDVNQLPILWAAMITGSLALSLLAGLGGAITAGLRRGGLLTALLILPLYIPVLVFGISVSAATIGPQSAWPSLLILIAITLLCLVVTPVASAAALKAYLR